MSAMTITISEFVAQGYELKVAQGQCCVFCAFGEVESIEISPNGYTVVTEKRNASGGRGVLGGLPVDTTLTVKWA